LYKRQRGLGYVYKRQWPGFFIGSPANVRNRQMITLTARWMINSFMQQHPWFARAFEKAWQQSGDRRPLPIFPETAEVQSMFIDAEPQPGKAN
jgi:hypothetical protein